jgi:hypothetical protein
MRTEKSLGYARYADDMIFGIKSGVDSQGIYLRFRQFFQTALEDLKLAETSLELTRRLPRKIRVLGLVVSIGPLGTLETRAPLNRWKRKFTIAHIMAKMDTRKKRNLPTFLKTLLPLIKIRIAFSFSCSYQYSEQEIIGYFHNLIRERANEFLKAVKSRRHPQQERLIGKLLNQLPKIVGLYKIRMREKGLTFLHRQNKE